MKFRSHILLFALLLALPALAQDNPDDKAHITPRATPTPTPAPKSTSSPARQDQYERPPLPGDVPGTAPAPKRQDGYDRPVFPGETPGASPTGEGASPTGESSSRDSMIDLSARPEPKETTPAEDDAVLQPWDPHKAAKDVEVGRYYFKIKNYRAALERFNHALVYKPNDAEATYGLAITQEKLDLLSLAAQNYHKYLAILPNGPKAKNAEEALKRIGPTQPPGPNGEPASIAAQDINVGESYLSTNNFDAARQRFEEALRITPDNPLIYFRLGQALQGMQRLDPARLNYRKYLELEPKGKFAQNARKAISDIGYILGK